MAARVERASGIGAQQQAGKGGVSLIKFAPDPIELGMIGLVFALLAPGHHDGKGAAQPGRLAQIAKDGIGGAFMMAMFGVQELFDLGMHGRRVAG